MLERIDYPEYRYDGLDDSFYKPFTISIEGEEIEIVPSELETLERLTSLFPSISASQVCAQVNGQIKKLDVSKLSAQHVAKRANKSVQDVQGIKEIDIYVGSIYQRPLMFYVGGKQNNLVLLFTQGEIQPGRYVRALEGGVKIA